MNLRVIDATDSPYWPFTTRWRYCEVQDLWRTKHLDEVPLEADEVDDFGRTFIWTRLLTLDTEDAKRLVGELQEWLEKAEQNTN